MTASLTNLNTPVQLYAGQVRPLPENGRPTGIFKTPVSGIVLITGEGLVGDAQADRTVHGGPDKALHYFPAEHFATLAQAFPECPVALVPGTLGENLSGRGLLEGAVCIGDTFTLGSARLQVSQPRQPCWKIDSRLAQEGVTAHIAAQGCTGWYFRVLTPGQAQAGDVLQRVESLSGAVSLAELWQAWQTHRPEPATLRHWLTLPLSATWAKKIRQRLEWLEANPPEATP